MIFVYRVIKMTRMPQSLRMRTAVYAGLVVVIAASVTGCSGQSGSPAQSTPAHASATTHSSTAARSATSSATSDGKSYAVKRSDERGAADNNAKTWTISVDLISDGEPQVTQAFNNAVQALAKKQLDSYQHGDTVSSWDFQTTPTIYFGGASIAELIQGVFMGKGAAHPLNTIGTVVIDSRSGKPITLTDLFTDKQAGLNRLSEQTKKIFPTEYENSVLLENAPGVAPKDENFANWIPTPAGLELHFADYQFGHGTPQITVPWSALDDVLAPGMDALRQPS